MTKKFAAVFPDQEISVRAYISGRVQGVGYRNSVRQYALQFGLRGTVRNASDGTVEVVVQGSSKKIDAFLEALAKISLPARTDRIDASEIASQQLFDRFEIIF